jgi:hypothetical protein
VLLFQTSSPLDSAPTNMGVEESVYLAKLAEQAERYEGEPDPKRSAGHPVTNLTCRNG